MTWAVPWGESQDLSILQSMLFLWSAETWTSTCYCPSHTASCSLHTPSRQGSRGCVRGCWDWWAVNAVRQLHCLLLTILPFNTLMGGHRDPTTQLMRLGTPSHTLWILVNVDVRERRLSAGPLWCGMLYSGSWLRKWGHWNLWTFGDKSMLGMGTRRGAGRWTFPRQSSYRLPHEGSRRNLKAHLISPQAWGWGRGDLAKTHLEIKLHPKASRPWITASSQIELSFTWSLFQNEDDTVILPRLKPRAPSWCLPLASIHTQSLSPDWAPPSFSLVFPPSPRSNECSWPHSLNTAAAFQMVSLPPGFALPLPPHVPPGFGSWESLFLLCFSAQEPMNYKGWEPARAFQGLRNEVPILS